MDREVLVRRRDAFFRERWGHWWKSDDIVLSVHERDNNQARYRTLDSGVARQVRARRARQTLSNDVLGIYLVTEIDAGGWFNGWWALGVRTIQLDAVTRNHPIVSRGLTGQELGLRVGDIFYARGITLSTIEIVPHLNIQQRCRRHLLETGAIHAFE
jgi:hypothetical protein